MAFARACANGSSACNCPAVLESRSVDFPISPTSPILHAEGNALSDESFSTAQAWNLTTRAAKTLSQTIPNFSETWLIASVDRSGDAVLEKRPDGRIDRLPGFQAFFLSVHPSTNSAPWPELASLPASCLMAIDGRLLFFNAIRCKLHVSETLMLDTARCFEGLCMDGTG